MFRESKKNKSETSISSKRVKELNEFCRSVNIKFKDISLLDQAFHHRSITNEKKEMKNNERLEFLGDSVLGMVTAAYLYNTLENPEGDLAKIKSVVVSEKSLAPIALKLRIDKLLILGKGEELSSGRSKPAILADCMEAIIGAYYLDQGYRAAETYVLSFIVQEIEKVLMFGGKDFKTLLQEKIQKRMKTFPVYEVVSKSGPEHDQTFEVIVHIGDLLFGPECGKTKKEAEQKVAEIAFNHFNSIGL